MMRALVALLALVLAGCVGEAAWQRCSRLCSPAGFRSYAREGCVCMDGGYDECACRADPVGCTANGGPGPREWRPG
jgi:hypothetical protein